MSYLIKATGLAISHDFTVLFNSIPTYGAFIALDEAQYFDYYFFTGSTDEELIKKYNWIRSKNREPISLLFLILHLNNNV